MTLAAKKRTLSVTLAASGCDPGSQQGVTLAATSVSARHIQVVPVNIGLNASLYAFQLRAIVQLIFKVQVFHQLIFQLTGYSTRIETSSKSPIELASSLRSPQAAKPSLAIARLLAWPNSIPFGIDSNRAIHLSILTGPVLVNLMGECVPRPRRRRALRFNDGCQVVRLGLVLQSHGRANQP